MLKRHRFLAVFFSLLFLFWLFSFLGLVLFEFAWWSPIQPGPFGIFRWICIVALHILGMAVGFLGFDASRHHLDEYRKELAKR